MVQTAYTESKYSISFYSDELNKVKYDIVKEKAVKIRDLRNEISEKIHLDMDFYKFFSREDMIKHFNCQKEGLLGQDIQNAIKDVHTSYSNKFEQILKKISFRLYEITPTAYKRNGKKLANGKYEFRKGDFKSWSKKSKSTPLTKVLSYIAKYGNENTYSYANKTILKLEQEVCIGDAEKTRIEKICFYKELVRCCDKFTFKRLYNLAMTRKELLFARYNQCPIKFESLTFGTTSRIKNDIIAPNKNKKSKIKAFITIGGFALTEANSDAVLEEKTSRAKSRSMDFPVKYHSKFHGEMNDYCSKEVFYLMSFAKGRLRIILSKNGIRPICTGGEEYIGADVNIKHNMFALSDGDTIDYDRNIIGGFVKFLKKIDKTKANKKTMSLPKEETSKLSNSNKRDMDYWLNKLLTDLKAKCNKLVLSAISKGKNHIVLEDLAQIGKGYSKNEEFEDMKYTRLWNMLHIASLKAIVRSIAYKHGICVSFVHPHYTSQMCNKCKHISRNNRKSQEKFECECCGHINNADNNAAKNIEFILHEDVLCEALLKQNNLGEYNPKKLSKDKIKDILQNHSYNTDEQLSGDDAGGVHTLS